MQLGLPFTSCEAPDLISAAPPAEQRGVTSPPPLSAEPASIFIRHSRARRYVIRVRPDGSVRVTIPRGGSRRRAEQFLREQHAWVARQRSRVIHEITAEAPRSPDRDTLARAKRELPARLLELADAHGLSVSRISVRNQRWRWGSCSPSGHICLNWRLVEMPAFVRDYVMIHELMHLRRMDHSPRFWKLVAAACPDYQVARKWLRDASTK
jgi:predicted metal-dependent hydrolase